MSSRNPSSRFARVRGVLVALAAITLLALYGFHHRAELGQIFDELRAVIPFRAREVTVQPSTWLESDYPQIP